MIFTYKETKVAPKRKKPKHGDLKKKRYGKLKKKNVSFEKK